MSLRLTAVHITPECRAANGVEKAWEDAVTRMRDIYMSQIEYDASLVISLAVERSSRVENPT